MKLVKESPFANSYGGLDLYQDDEGRYFLVMEDVSGGSEFGPLTDAQVEAFHTLSEATKYDE